MTENDREKQPLNPRQRCAPRKQLTRNRKVHDIESSLDKLILKRLVISIEREILKNI